MCLIVEHARAKQYIKVLEAELNHFKLTPVGTISVQELTAVLEAKLREMGDTKTEIFLADSVSRLYKKSDVQKLLKLSETAFLKYVPEDMDCDNFAGVMYGEFCRQDAFPGGIVDSFIHRLIWFVDENKTFWFIEPQTRTMSQHLDSSEGWQIRWFLA